jgi:ethanolamine phosphate transferase 2 subunit G
LKRNRQSDTFGVISAALMVGLRLTSRWNQTGQKLVGAPDIARHYLPNHPVILWALVIATYLDLQIRITRHGFRRLPRGVANLLSLALCSAAFTFKVCFTNADSPELIRGLWKPITALSDDYSLVTLARVVFAGICGITIYTSIFEYKSKDNNVDEDKNSKQPSPRTTSTQAAKSSPLIIKISDAGGKSK